MQLVFDIETDGLNPSVIWCLVAQDVISEKFYHFYEDTLNEGIKFLQQADTLIGHNILGYDIPVIKKLTGVDLYNSDKIIDTLVLSRLLNPTREGGHSIAKWGYKLGVPKKDSPEWSSFTKEMLSYCERDVAINTKLLRHLRKESLGFSKECIKLEHKVTHILEQQKQNGFLFNDEQAMFLASELSCKLKETEDKVHETFKPIWVDDKMVKPKLKKDGKLSKQGLTEQEYSDIIEGTLERKPFMRKTLQEFNLGSRKQIGQRLQELGWKPQKFTPTGQAIVDETTLKKITHIKEAQLIADFLLYQKRLAQVHSWIDAVYEDDGRVHGSVICTGAITGRMAHRSPNMAQVPAVYSPYGKECRSCWVVPKGYKLVGIDASGLELRLLAHYMADEEYVNEIINGDIHTANQQFAGLKSRDEAKTFIYALIYGAGDEKIGSIIKGNRADGKRLRERFLSGLPTLRTLKERVDRAAEKGYLKGLDGRKILLRHKHAALNTLLQGGGAIAMKKALIILEDNIRLNGLDAKFVANIHDEWQIQVLEKQADFVGRLGVQAIEQAGQHYNMRCPLTGEYKIGDSWYETH
jgi:DNA polymerase I-like protein with 3'-5' exonuclease and polymerase domains